MQIVIRTDASLKIGTGHVMRCLTLADALKERGDVIRFICRNLPGNLIEFIGSKGYQVYTLEFSESSLHYNVDQCNKLLHSHWLGASQMYDADECKKVLKNIEPDWLVVDHYAIDYHWHEQLKNYCKKLMVIDDLADRRQDCDLLLDQTFGRKPEDYQALVPIDCKLLMGAQFALLRPEFKQWREYSLKRRDIPEFKKILVTMGGVDSENITGQVLNALSACELSVGITITVIMGITSPNLERVKQIAESMPYKTEVKVNVSNMAELMANADLAIGAAGATTWERCCLGLPTLMVVLADNQELIAGLIDKAGAAVIIGRYKLEGLCNKLVILSSELQKKSSIAAQLVDGQGTYRVVECML